MAITIPRAAPLRIRARTLVKATVSTLTTRAKRTSRLVRARIGYGTGLASTAWGVGVLFGFGWALVAGGIATSVSFLVLYPVDET